MTKKANLVVAFGIVSLCVAFAQDSPAPSASNSPTPTETPAISRSVRISFVPPPMEGTISLGIFDTNKKLVRVLHRGAKIDDFKIDESSLTTSWDGKNDAGDDLPVGKYHARGYLVGDLKSEEVTPTPGSPPVEISSDHISIRLVTNPLLADTRSVVDIGVGFDSGGSFLRTMDNLPLFSVSATPNLTRVAIAKAGDKSALVWHDDGQNAKECRVSNIDKMMAFDCGDIELR